MSVGNIEGESRMSNLACSLMGGWATNKYSQ